MVFFLINFCHKYGAVFAIYFVVVLFVFAKNKSHYLYGCRYRIIRRISQPENYRFDVAT